MKILGIDTSGKIASAALCDEERVIAETTVLTNLTHSQVILPLCKKMLEDSGQTLDGIDGIAVADGPGSYTGLRIGISAVKAMSFALGKPCIGISTLEGLAYNLMGIKGTVCPVMTARQNLVYASLFNSDGKKIERMSEDKVISTEELFSRLSKTEGDIYLTGDAAKSCAIDFSLSNILTAPPVLRLQKASGLCYAAMTKELISPEMLNARYLQQTKAEKDRMSVI